MKKVFLLFCIFTCCMQAYGAEPTEEDVREVYDFSTVTMEKKQYRIFHILMADRSLAERIARRVASGESFEQLASIHSIDFSTLIKGGDLGWNVPSNFVPSFAKTVTTVALNRVSSPVQTPFGWHLIKVTETRPNTEATFESIKTQMAANLKKKLEDLEAAKSDKERLNGEISAVAVSAPVLRKLIALGADVNARHATGSYPLHRAATLGLVQQTDILLRAGAKPDVSNAAGMTPLHIGCFTDRTGAITKLLLDRGAIARGQLDSGGLAPIHHAAIGDSAQSIRLLVERGENPDREDRNGMLPLMLGADQDAFSAVAALLVAGADPLQRRPDPGQKGKVPILYSALDYALLGKPADGVGGLATIASLRKAASQKALPLDRSTFKAYVLQDQQRTLVSGQAITLKPKPFTLQIVVTGEPISINATAVDLGKSARNSTSILQRLDSDLKESMRSMALSPDSSNLFVFSADDTRPGHQSFFYDKENNQFTKFHPTATGFVGTRDIAELDFVPSSESPQAKVVTQKLANAELPNPILLTLFSDVPLGMFEFAVKERFTVQLLWRK